MDLRDPAFWRELMPILHTDGSALRAPEADIAELSADLLRREGWFHRDGVLDPADTKKVLAGVLALRQRGMSPVWSWAWDETWALFLRMAPLWRAWLGPDWRILPALWTWYVPAEPGQRGWTAHQDRAPDADVLEPDGAPRFLSAWVPLTPATPANGCMYLLPMGHRPAPEALPEVRALPARPGAVIGWNHAVWHWSGRMSPDAPCPRVSVSLELRRGAADRAIDPADLPPLDVRLRLVAEMFRRYSHMTTVDDVDLDLAERVAI